MQREMRRFDDDGFDWATERYAARSMKANVYSGPSPLDSGEQEVKEKEPESVYYLVGAAFPDEPEVGAPLPKGSFYWCSVYKRWVDEKFECFNSVSGAKHRIWEEVVKNQSSEKFWIIRAAYYSRSKIFFEAFVND